MLEAPIIRTETYPFPEPEFIDWRQDAACKEVEDKSIFFPAKGESTKLAAARAICGECVVREECLDFALDVNEQHGVYGGLSRKQRLAIRKQDRSLRSGDII